MQTNRVEPTTLKSPSHLLSCWKEIARFFGKGVRTVQRWEALGMPVYRPNGDNRVVFADPEELRRWALRNNSLVATMEKTLARPLSVSERRMIQLAEDIIANESQSPSPEQPS